MHKDHTTIKFSIIIPTFNRAHLLEMALQSILSQSYQHYEIIIVDDYSTDETPSLVAKYTANNNSKIKYLTNNRSKGANGARNTGVAESGNEWILFLDSDDSWQSDKLSKFAEEIAANENDFAIFFDSKKPINIKNLAGNRKEYLSILPLHNIIGGFSRICINKVILERVGCLDESLLSRQDLDLYLRVASSYDIFNIPLELTYIDTTNNNRISDNHFKKAKGYDQVIRKHRHLYNKNTLSYIYIVMFNRFVKAKSWKHALNSLMQVAKHTISGGNGIYVYLSKKKKIVFDA